MNWETPDLGELWAHAVALWAVRLLLRRIIVRTPGPPVVTILMAHAYGTSGVPRSVFTLADHLIKRHEVMILNLDRHRRDPHFPFPRGVRVVTLDDRVAGRVHGWRGVVQRVLSRFRSRLIHPGDLAARQATLWTDLRLVRALCRIRSGIVIGTRPSMNILAAQMTRPGLVTIGQEHRDLTRRVPSLRTSMQRHYRGLSALAVLTDADRQRYEALLEGATRVVTIPNAVPALSPGLSDLSQPVVLATGRLTPQKGFDLLIRSFASKVAAAEPQWRLRIRGTGPRREGLEAMIERRGLRERIEMPGWTPDTAAELEGASIFALSSRSEGFPLALLEAMSKGLPVVAYDCPNGPAAIVEHGRTGFLIPAGDVDAFGEALLELIGDAPKRRAFGRAGVERAADWHSSRVLPRWDRLIGELSPA